MKFATSLRLIAVTGAAISFSITCSCARLGPWVASKSITTGVDMPCATSGYRHKTVAEIQSMTSKQKIEELVNEQSHHMPDIDDYSMTILTPEIRKDGSKALSPLSQYLLDYEPSDPCADIKILVVVMVASDLDSFVFRVRTSTDGQDLIRGLTATSVRMQASPQPKGSGRASFVDLVERTITQLRSINAKDEEIRQTLESQWGVKLSNSDLVGFVDFLIADDPTYPAWSQIVDGPPPHVLKNGEPFHKAYIRFLNSRR